MRSNRESAATAGGVASARAASFEEFVAARGDALWRRALLLTGDPGLAEDLVQDVLLKCWPRWGRISATGDFEAYARRVLFTTHTRRWRRRHLGEPGAASRAGDGLPEPGSVVDRDASGVARRRDIGAALATLTPAQRAVVVLRWYDDLSVEETAEVLGVSAGTVKSQSARAMRALRRSEHLAGYDTLRAGLEEQA